MPSDRERPHIVVPTDRFRTSERYRPHGGGGPGPVPGPPATGRAAHAQALAEKLTAAKDHAAERRAAAAFDVAGTEPGLYLEFESFPGWELAVESMGASRARDPKKHIEVVAVAQREPPEGDDGETKHVAAVFVPDGKVGHFIKQLEKYALETPKQPRERRHENVYDRIADLRLATLKALWTDAEEAYPADDDSPIWWEVWLRRTDGEELIRLHEFAEKAEVRLGERRLQFDDRIVTLAYGTPNQLAASLDVLSDIAELQRAKETATFFVELDAKDQADWVDDLVARTTLGPADAPAVCVLDTGVNRGHPLLEGALAAADCHAVEPGWGVHDHDQHGTAMAGLALYGDLVPVLETALPVDVSHRLESVKILPPVGANEPDLYAAITADAANRPEIQAPFRRRVFSLAITTDDYRDRGLPTSWSAAVDALAAGRSFDPTDKGLVYVDDGEDPQRRLFVISAGNVDPMKLEPGHIDRSDAESVQDPAHAWNALTVGAYTEKVVIDDPTWAGWTPAADSGELSPWSTTSTLFARAWPIKPDVVLEGGNVVKNGAGDMDFPCDDLSLLTTYFKPFDKPFVTTWATSAATSQAARMCAIISASYPNLWPETVRALMVHSAEWTPAMQAHFDAAPGKTARGALVRRYGFGVPGLARALRSAGDAVTLVVQDVISPFDDGKMREIHLHELPWPHEALLDLGEAVVRLRVTLSYFIEPNPGRRGWRRKHRYQSHALRFDVKGATESVDEFRKRINSAALDEEENRPTADDQAGNWYLGPRVRDKGSLHSDVLVGLTAAELAERGVLAVYPVTGWWKEQKARDRSEQGARYALVVSIETDAVGADLWTPIANVVGVPVEVVIG